VALFITFLFVGMFVPVGVFYLAGWFVGLSLIAMTIGIGVRDLLSSHGSA
jgi:hypothetical protein